MKVYYDFHIHTCLSPCGDNDNTPNNIVNMAKLKGLNAIAISDHNSVLNAKACMEVGKKIGLLVIPAMELTTSEDIHVLILFYDIESAEKFGEYVSIHQMKIKNEIDIFGKQEIMDGKDKVVGSLDNLLTVATDIGVYDVVKLAKKYNGFALPAHINRMSNSIISILGEIDDMIGFSVVELNSNPNFEITSHYDKYSYIKDSDAHYLWDISEQVNYLYVSGELTIKSVIDSVKKLKEKR